MTPEILKKRDNAKKTARQAGKKPAEVRAAVDAAVALSDKQKEVIESTEAELAKVKVAIGKLLEPDQFKNLPENFAKSLKEKKKGANDGT